MEETCAWTTMARMTTFARTITTTRTYNYMRTIFSFGRKTKR
jgi:hypothetical protein